MVRRRFRDRWSINFSYTLSETKGNCYNVWNIWCAHEFTKLRDIEQTADNGEPLSMVNRDGYQSNHLPHVFKVRGNYIVPLGKGHMINLGGFARWQSGRRWTHIEQHVDVHGTVDLIEYLEPAGSRALESTYQIDLNTSWRFPISWKARRGSRRPSSGTRANRACRSR